MINKIIDIIKKNKSIILYLIFGVSSTILNIACYAIFTKVLKIDYVISNIIAWIAAVTFAYFTNRVYVFDSQASSKKSVFKEFVLFYYYRIVTLLIETAILYICVDILKFNDIIIKVIANILVILLNYVFSKFFIFKRGDKMGKKKGFFGAWIWNIKEYGFFRGSLKFLIKGLQKIEVIMDRRVYLNFKIEDDKHKEKVRNEIKQLLNNPKYKYIFVFYPYTEWRLPIFQRPQQIALALTSHRDDILYFYCTTNCMYDKINRLEKINDNLYITTEYDYILKNKSNKMVLHLYSTDIISRLDEIEEAYDENVKILYEYIDEIHEDITQNMPHGYLRKHKSIVSDDKYFVVATADKLLNDLKEIRNKNYTLATNGVNVEDFVISENKKRIPDELKKLKQKYERIICYYGALAKWFDYELLEKCAKAYPNYCFLLIGIEYDTAMQDSNILKNNKNIVYIGKVDYDKLVHFASNVDLLTIPFLINDITKSTSPVKLFEYMALRIPILTTNLPECAKYKSVNIGKTHEEYVKKIDECISLLNDEKYKELEAKEAEENSWYKKANDIINLLDGNSK